MGKSFQITPEVCEEDLNLVSLSADFLKKYLLGLVGCLGSRGFVDY